jgi:hypothetical protein
MRKFSMGGLTLQKHNLCGKCGKPVARKSGARKCDGWMWHYECWARFLTARKR